jgi:SSS family solute:Na+ symporter
LPEINWVALSVFLILFAAITILGFAAGRWRRGDMDHLHEWGLGGQRFGTIVTWFLMGGDLFTAYTFIALPALAFGAGAIAFFAIPYTVLVYPIMFLVFPRLWAVARAHGYITASDFVKGRYGNRWLALAVALTGIVAVMPYIALQLVGLQVVIGGLGLTGSGIMGEMPLVIAFIILAAFTYSSGIRAPALIAVVKDVLIYVAVIAAVIVIPVKLGGFGKIFAAVPADKLILAAPGAHSLGAYGAYATLALGSALALLLYPHSMTGLLSAKSGHAIRRNAALLPAYSLVLALLTLLGYMALASGLDKMPEFAPGFKAFGNNFAVPALYLHNFPSWFAGLAFAAIGIGALVPAAIMSIAAANLFTRNIYREFLRPGCSHKQESQVAKRVSLVVKFGALIFVIFLPLNYAIQLQLLGGVFIIQTLPAVILGLYTRWFNPWGLLAGWAAGMICGTWMVSTLGFKNSVYPLSIGDYTMPGYAALYSLILNIAVAAALTLACRSLGSGKVTDETAPADYI